MVMDGHQRSWTGMDKAEDRVEDMCMGSQRDRSFGIELSRAGRSLLAFNPYHCLLCLLGCLCWGH